MLSEYLVPDKEKHWPLTVHAPKIKTEKIVKIGKR